MAKEETVTGIGTETNDKRQEESGRRQGRELFEFIWDKMGDIGTVVRLSRVVTGEEVPLDLQDDTIRLVATMTYILRYFDICSDNVAAAYFDDFINGEIAHQQLKEQRRKVNEVIKGAYEKFGPATDDAQASELREWVETELHRRGVSTENVAFSVPGADKSMYGG